MHVSDSMCMQIQKEFRAEFASGMMEIVHAPDYEQLRDPSKVQRTWNDSLERCVEECALCIVSVYVCKMCVRVFGEG